MTKIKITPENKCSFCKGTKCCSYFTQQIDTPRSKEDFQTLLWQIAHHNVDIYQDEDGWFLLINNPCQFLEKSGACGIYKDRPTICRDMRMTGVNMMNRLRSTSSATSPAIKNS